MGLLYDLLQINKEILTIKNALQLNERGVCLIIEDGKVARFTWE